ncbi:MAG: DNA-3-methyladenine glycosylase I [Alphaproteobacteria bacterium]
MALRRAAVLCAGGEEALKMRLPTVRSAAALRRMADDRYLSDMARRVFRAGLRHSMVDDRWPAFEEVFLGFEPRRVVAMDDEALEGLMGESRIIRHWGKIRSVRDNAAAMLRVAQEAGSFGAWLAAWPITDTTGLWRVLRKEFSQLGGHSGPRFLRMVGRDTFLLTEDVARGLANWWGLDKPPKGARGELVAQAAFNEMRERWEGGKPPPLAHLSMMLAVAADAS